jgi:hypothetical protein
MPSYLIFDFIGLNIFSQEQILYARYYVVLCNPLLFSLSYAQVVTLAPRSRTYAPLLIQEIIFHTHTNNS